MLGFEYILIDVVLLLVLHVLALQCMIFFAVCLVMFYLVHVLPYIKLEGFGARTIRQEPLLNSGTTSPLNKCVLKTVSFPSLTFASLTIWVLRALGAPVLFHPGEPFLWGPTVQPSSCPIKMPSRLQSLRSDARQETWSWAFYIVITLSFPHHAISVVSKHSHVNPMMGILIIGFLVPMD